MEISKIPLIVICGPTASGKTSIAIEIAKKTGAHIISADSRQVYKFLSIGTAKPSDEELNLVPHYFIDILDPHKKCDAVFFAEFAEKKIIDLYKQNIPCIVTGGTQFYIQALLEGFFEGPSGNKNIRDRLNEIAMIRGNIYLHRMLQEIDKESADRLHYNDRVRVVRAIEIFELTGMKMSEFFMKQSRKSLYDTQIYSIMREDRNLLYEGIEKRVDEMLKAGLVREVENIMAMGYNKTANSLCSIGYPEIIQFLDGEISLEEAISLIKRNTRRFAKRQLTWLRRLKNCIAVNIDNVQQRKDAVESASEFLRRKFHVQNQV
jgi:tRNA dimethylallyltransferase